MKKQLPKNWVKTEFKEIISYVIGGDWGKDSNENNIDFVEVLCIRGSEIKNWINNKGNTASIRKIKKSSLLNRELEKGDILLEISGGGPDQPVGRTVIIDDEVLNFEPSISKVCTNFLRLVRIEKNISSEYVNHYLQFFYSSGEIVKYQGGSNNLRNLKFKEYETIKIPLPPPPEQHRIVAKLDMLFNQLETIKTSMANIPLLLKDFRKQVLTQAVTGKLTEEWRKGEKLGEWKNVSIENLINSLKTDIRTGPFGSALKKEEHKSEGIPVWGIESIGLNGKFTGSNKIYVTKEKAFDLKSFEVKGGNIIISRSGTVGELCILPHDIEYGLISTNLMKIILNNNVINSKYFCWLFKGSPVVIEKLNDLCKGSTRLFLTQTILKNLVFPLPPLEEQQEIVSRVESLFAKADTIEQQYKSLKAKIDTLPQAILHKAFKGELSEQLDTDGNARELLKQIQELKNSAVKPKKATIKKTKNYPEGDGVLGMVAEP